MASPRLCSVADCDKPHHGRGLCSFHWTRSYRHGGDPIARRERAAVARFLEDDLLSRHHRAEDPCIVWPFGRGGSGYGQIRWLGRKENVSRRICILVHGEPPIPQHQAAHLCLNGHAGCVNPAHVYWATPKQNYADRRGRIRRMLGSSCPPGFWSAQPPSIGIDTGG